MAVAGPVPISQSAQLRLRGTALCSRPPSSGPASEQLPGLGGDRAVIDDPASGGIIKAGEKDDGLGGSPEGRAGGLLRGDGVELRLLSFLSKQPHGL